MGDKSQNGPGDVGDIFVWLFWVPRCSSAEGHYGLAAIAWVRITILRPLIVIMKEDTTIKGMLFATPVLNNCKPTFKIDFTTLP